MQDVSIILDGGIASCDIRPVSLGLNVAPSEPEKPTAADDGHLPDLIEHQVPANYSEIAAIVLAFNESQIHDHQEPKLVLIRRNINPLCSSDALRARVWPDGKRVVDYVCQPEAD
ncbi:unnamed protein product [Cuscuta epithymum]|uniref:Uncharacterized protein n=1 Tax=Cuscuta epithymum TaxID=186058 RepID=A0AAV0CTS0_9ASTE|nr:unnamed protein product [Cuscuta epithymum]